MATTPPEIKKILEEQKLAEIKIVSTHYHNYCSICLNEKGRKIYFKAHLYPKLVRREDFIKEVISTKFLSENFYSNGLFLTPKHYNSDIGKKPEWLAREYIEGKRTGDVWGFEPEFYQKFPPQRIAGILDFIREEIPEKFREEIKESEARLFEKEGAAEYKNYFLRYLPFAGKYPMPTFDAGLRPRYQTLSAALTADQKKVMEIFEKYKATLNKNNCLAHSDLHPGNIISSGDQIMLHDWKYAHWDNCYLDFTFVWLLSWTNEKWRRDLFNLEMARVGDKNLFLTLFGLSVCKLTTKIISILLQAGAISENDRQRGIKKTITAFKQAIKNLFSRRG